MTGPRNRETPWGESYAELADAVLADRSAPPVLVLAAFVAKRGDDRRLRSLIADAVALNEQEVQRDRPT